MVNVYKRELRQIEATESSELSLLILGAAEVNPYCSIIREWSGVIKALNSRTHFIDYFSIYRERGHKGLKEYILDVLNERDISAIYFQDIFNSEFDLDFIEQLRKRYFIFGFFPDSFEYFDRTYRYLAQVFDLILVDGLADKMRFSSYGSDVLFMPPCYAPHDYVNLNMQDRPIDVSFIGRVDRVDRKGYMDHIRANNINIETFGIGTPRGLLGKQDMIGIFNKSRINLNFSGLSGIFNNKIESRIKQFKGRCCEIALTNSFVLTEFSPDLQELFDIGNEIDVFHNEKELIEKIKFYLDNEPERNRIARGGYLRALRDYDSGKVWRKVLNAVARKAKNKKYAAGKIFVDRMFNGCINSGRAGYLYFFLRKGKFGMAREVFLRAVGTGCRDLIRLFFFTVKCALKDFLRYRPGLKRLAERIRKK